MTMWWWVQMRCDWRCAATNGSTVLLTITALTWLSVLSDKPPANCSTNVIAWHDIPSATTNSTVLQWTTQGHRDRRRPKNTWKKRPCVDSMCQVQLEEDGGGSTGQSWMARSDLWPTFHAEQQGRIHHSISWNTSALAALLLPIRYILSPVKVPSVLGWENEKADWLGWISPLPQANKQVL